MRVFVFEQNGEGFDDGGKIWVLGFHLGAKPAHNRHGAVKGVFVDSPSVLPDECEYCGKAAPLEYGPCFPRAYQFQNLDALLG